MGESGQQMLQRARREVMEWSASEVERRVQAGEAFPIVDVRETIEWKEGHLPEAIHVPRGYLELQIEEALPDKAQPVVLYCAGGVRSLLAAETLRQMGYRQPISLSGGYTAWRNAGFATVVPRVLDDETRKRLAWWRPTRWRRATSSARSSARRRA